MSRRVAILLLAFAVVVVLTMQAIPYGMLSGCGPMPMTAEQQAGGGSAPGNSTAPCKDIGATCIGNMACATAAALPMNSWPPTHFAWVAETYRSTTPKLFGRSPEPELTPPILPV